MEHPCSGQRPLDGSWTYVSAPFSTNQNNNVYAGSFTAPAPGTYSYAFRVSEDSGLSFTYCDKSGSGKANGLPSFSASDLGTMTVNP